MKTSVLVLTNGETEVLNLPHDCVTEVGVCKDPLNTGLNLVYEYVLSLTARFLQPYYFYVINAFGSSDSFSKSML